MTCRLIEYRLGSIFDNPSKRNASTLAQYRRRPVLRMRKRGTERERKREPNRIICFYSSHLRRFIRARAWYNYRMNVIVSRQWMKPCREARSLNLRLTQIIERAAKYYTAHSSLSILYIARAPNASLKLTLSHNFQIAIYLTAMYSIRIISL